ncbi:Ribonuclease III [Desulfonema limicola]|uniref:Ribonuclease 3 n=1 Tax=Desulfonema limicola TaxID=45656 RepID=A0A975BCI0_9BACT|nr:ribonuclease III [Desulfonema limicola]QTA82675.1 Ribonuclease III [Desulfonema limicola]
MQLSKLEKKLSYIFKDKTLIQEACRHSSFVNEHPDKLVRDNERLEFLGDAVLNLVIGHLLMKQYPDIPEGDLSRMRANLVNEIQLAKIARFLGIGKYLELGKGEEQTKGREKNSILADAFEAVIAAIYLDTGFNSAFDFIDSQFSKLIPKMSVPALNYDYKSKLQEVIQVNHKVMPGYKIENESGPDHDKTFVVSINFDNIKVTGTGKSKKTAEQDAAKKALESLNII